MKRRKFFFSLLLLQYFLFLHTPYVMRMQQRFLDNFETKNYYFFTSGNTPTPV